MRHWGKHRLGELVEILSGFAFDSEKFGDSGEMPIVRIRDVVRGRSSTFYNGEYDKKYVLRDGDMLIGMDGEFNLAKWQGGPAVLNQRVCRIAASNGSLDDGYLFRFLPAALKAIEDVTPYVTVKHLSVKTIRDIEIPLPPLAEQRRIAEVLDRAEALRAKRRAALAQLDSLTQSLFLDLFGDPKANPKKWPKHKLGELLEIEWGNTSITKESYVPEGVPAYSAAGCDGFLPKGEHEGEGIVLSAIGARCGKCFYVSGGSWTAIKNTITISPKQKSLVDLRYVFPMANDERFWPNRGAGQPFITLGVARVQEIPVPPIPLQREFARRVTAVEALKTAQRASLAELDALFATLQHRAFRGEL